MSRMDFTAAAMRYAELGWHVFPLAAGTKLPAMRKQPGAPENSSGVHLATDEADQIVLWGKKFPHANVGIACGEPSQIVVLDVDPRNGGDVSLVELAAKGRVLPNGPRAKTGNDGLHIFLRYQPGITNSKRRLGPGLDVRSTGGYVVGAPSWIRASKDGPGGIYEWQISPFHTPLPRVPVWVSALLCPPPGPARTYSPDISGGDIAPLARFITSAPVGERNNRLYWAACRAREAIAKRRLSESTAVQHLTMAAEACGLKGAEVLRTIRSGLAAGEKGNA